MARKPKTFVQPKEIVEVPAKSKEELAAMSSAERKEYAAARRAYRVAMIESGKVIAGRKPVPENETGEEKFMRLATDRVTAIGEKIKLLQNLSNRSSYDYNDEMVGYIFDTLQKELETCRRQFEGKSKTKFSFSLIKKGK